MLYIIELDKQLKVSFVKGLFDSQMGNINKSSVGNVIDMQTSLISFDYVRDNAYFLKVFLVV